MAFGAGIPDGTGNSFLNDAGSLERELIEASRKNFLKALKESEENYKSKTEEVLEKKEY